MKDLDIIKMRIRGFLALRHMIYQLTQNDGEASQVLRENPLRRDDERREIAKWIQGGSYSLPADQ